MRLRWQLRAAHRWLGATLCVLFVVWFASGIVMTFAGFPRVSEHERLVHAQPLQAAAIRLSPAAALAEVEDSADSVVLEALDNRALYVVRSGTRTRVLYADNAPQPNLLDEQAVVAASLSWFQGARADSERLAEVDQWTPQADRRGELPCLRLRARDAAGSELYVSLRDGEVLQRTTRRSRFLAWIGAIPHWLYPIQLRRHGGAWRALLIALSALGAVASATGLVRGLLVARIARRARGRRLSWSPFRERWLAWHHLLGLGFGLLSFTWVASGLLSFYPLASWAESSPTEADVAALRGAPLAPRSFERDPRAALAECQIRLQTPIKRLVWARVGGAPFYICKNGAGATLVVSAASDLARSARDTRARLVDAVRALGQGTPVASETWLHEADAYYYPSHFEPDLAFPVLRTRFASGLVTYVSPESMSVVRRYSRGAASYRWLYHGLHSLDFPALYRRAWLWHPLIVAALLGGCALAASGAWLSLRWARSPQRRGVRASRAEALHPVSGR